MMKITTINKLNSIAKIISEKILLACKTGNLRKSLCDDEQTRFESIKRTITKNMLFWHVMCNIDYRFLVNLYKTTRHLNYLSNEVLYYLRRNGFFKEYVPTQNYVQGTFNF